MSDWDNPQYTPETTDSMDTWGEWDDRRNMKRGKGVKVIPISDKYRANWEKIFKKGKDAKDN